MPEWKSHSKNVWIIDFENYTLTIRYKTRALSQVIALCPALGFGSRFEAEDLEFAKAEAIRQLHNHVVASRDGLNFLIDEIEPILTKP